MKPPRGASTALRKAWRAKMIELEALGLERLADPLVVEQWCRWRVIADEAFADIAARGHIVDGSRPNTRVKNPSVSTLSQATAEMSRLDKQLGTFRPQDRKAKQRRLRVVDPAGYLNGGAS
ncbi:P27 family phage terminase small subunit [Gordonia sp. DT219]|uniref:P27 family phage terminase small subunit n=1 Tax=Gordonia sp. DT219 TaxID=3416658 RepID=UPI003CE8F8A0